MAKSNLHLLSERGQSVWIDSLSRHMLDSGGLKQLMKDDDARGPNLTHFATRHTFAGGLYSADPRSLARWVKNAPVMKPGSIMPTLGVGEYNPQMKLTVTPATGLDDRQIADIVAYLMALK